MRINILSREGPGVAEFQLSPGEGKKQSIHVLGVTPLWFRGSSGLHAHTHCFTPVLPALESSWTKPLHASIAWPVHSLLLNCFGRRKLFCLWSPFCHKKQGFFGKEELFLGKDPVENLAYTL